MKLTCLQVSTLVFPSGLSSEPENRSRCEWSLKLKRTLRLEAYSESHLRYNAHGCPTEFRQGARKPSRVHDPEDIDARDDFNDDGEAKDVDDPVEVGGEDESGDEKEERDVGGTVDLAAEVCVWGGHWQCGRDQDGS